MTQRIAVVIPCYRVVPHILQVLDAVGPEVCRIYVVDDHCPDGSGDHVDAHCRDPRVVVLRQARNEGVGGAVMAGYRAALAAGMDVMVKLDGDGQMDPALIPALVRPLCDGTADYAKGNRFFDLAGVRGMPPARLVGNAALSLMTKLSSGYWDVRDPTNGFTAIHAGLARALPFGHISQRYFFEMDMLFHLNALQAVVVDVPMHARYGNETSHLKIHEVLGEFLFKQARNATRRLARRYLHRTGAAARGSRPQNKTAEGTRMTMDAATPPTPPIAPSEPREPAPSVVWHAGRVSPDDRARLLGHKPLTIWLTGLSAAGKSTLAFALEKQLTDRGRACYVLDGDNVRHGLNRNLGFSVQDRAENIRRVAEVARLMNDAGLIVITAFISPFRADRTLARDIIGPERLREVHVSTSLAVCESRDPKGFYVKARAGEIADFTGITSPYEPPLQPALTIDTAAMSIDQALAQLQRLADAG